MSRRLELIEPRLQQRCRAAGAASSVCFDTTLSGGAGDDELMSIHPSHPVRVRCIQRSFFIFVEELFDSTPTVETAANGVAAAHRYLYVCRPGVNRQHISRDSFSCCQSEKKLTAYSFSIFFFFFRSGQPFFFSSCTSQHFKGEFFFFQQKWQKTKCPSGCYGKITNCSKVMKMGTAVEINKKPETSSSLEINQWVHPSIHPSLHLSLYQPMYLCTYIPIIHPSIYHPSIHPSTQILIHPSICK